MFAYLHGKPVSKQGNMLVIDVSGIGYEVAMPLNDLCEITIGGAPLTIHSALIVREDDQSLYGFLKPHSKALFKALIKVNGVGPKMALALMSAAAHDELIHHIHSHNIVQLIKIPGVGRKTAERLVIELADKVGALATAPTLPAQEGMASEADQEPHHLPQTTRIEAQLALEALGYKSLQAEKAIKKVIAEQANSSLENLIREALKTMVS